MTKEKVNVAMSRTKGNCWRFWIENKKYSNEKWENPVPAEFVGDAIEDIAYYVENDLGCECNFYFE